MRARRFITLHAIAGTLTVLVVAVLAASGERAHQAQAQAPGTETLELVNVEIVRGGLFADTWAITERSASLDIPPYSHGTPGTSRAASHRAGRRRR